MVRERGGLPERPSEPSQGFVGPHAEPETMAAGAWARRRWRASRRQRVVGGDRRLSPCSEHATSQFTWESPPSLPPPRKGRSSAAPLATDLHAGRHHQPESWLDFLLRRRTAGRPRRAAGGVGVSACGEIAQGGAGMAAPPGVSGTRARDRRGSAGDRRP